MNDPSLPGGEGGSETSAAREETGGDSLRSLSPPGHARFRARPPSPPGGTSAAITQNACERPRRCLFQSPSLLRHRVEKIRHLAIEEIDIGGKPAAGRRMAGDGAGVDRHDTHVADIARRLA